jgi:Cu-processing system ATP-binding protein
MLAGVLRTAGAVDVVYKTGSIVADIPRTDKIKILSVLMDRKEGVKDLSIREPNLEEVFFGVH